MSLGRWFLPLGTTTVTGGCEWFIAFAGKLFLLPELLLGPLDSSVSVINDPDDEEGGEVLVPLEVEGGELSWLDDEDFDAGELYVL